MSGHTFHGGVIEGFKGRPWNARQRHQLFSWMRAWKLNRFQQFLPMT
ncbi:MAG: hypothetical protein FJ398_05805 [Verrucomicrobia bacterium]|nr:hypothetical protein [Verrucomicrobiota bacterium]